MRFKIAAILVGATFLLAGAPIALASTTEHSFSGEIKSLDWLGETLSLKESAAKNAKEMSFSVAPEATIMRGPKATSLEELKVGEHVKVTYLDKGSAHQAQRIEVLPGKISKAAPARKSATKSKY
jgi:hypothetical protein